MSYICKNPNCTAPESKKAKSYPSAMECPFCDVPLVEVVSISESDLNLIGSLPYVIAYPLKRALVEKHPLTRINLLRDTFLNYLKYLGLITASEFFNSPIKDKNMVALFNRTLTETSFGLWNDFIRETLKFLINKNHAFFCPELSEYYVNVQTGGNRKLYKGEVYIQDAYGETTITRQNLTGINSLINFRNRYLGHQQTLDDAKYVSLWEQYFPIFRDLLVQMTFCADYPMYKTEHGETYRLQSDEIKLTETASQLNANVWIEDRKGNRLDILPFFVVPGELSIKKEDKEQILIYESTTLKTIKFFSPEGTEKQTSGKIMERLNLLLRDKQQEQSYTPEIFTKEVFIKRIADENKLILDTLVAEKKVIPGVYVNRQDIEIKLKEWIGAKASIFFIAAQAGSGKTNLLAEMQKQYTELGLNSLLIRAGRMEKQGLTEQIAYLLNIDSSMGLSAYPSIAGTQEAPTMILIDGLNEAFHAENMWLEVLELIQLFEPGTLKFVITARANTNSELERYNLLEEALRFIYGENRDQVGGLAEKIFWLNALNMEEMKCAWESYGVNDKSRFKPLFSFDEIARFDRSIYDQINNPLILRIFLEVYNLKNLPKKGGNYLNIWKDWFATFSDDEQALLNLLSREIWIKGENELLLDDLLKSEMLKHYLISDDINGAYQRLKSRGWLSRYVKELNIYISYTVEGVLLYLIATQLQSNSEVNSVSQITSILKKGTRLQKSATEYFLCEEALAGNLNLVTSLIDSGERAINICIHPLLCHLKIIGVEQTITKVLGNPTDNDWKAFIKLYEMIDELQLDVLGSMLSNKLIEFIKQNNLSPGASLLISILPFAKTEYKNEFISKFEDESLSKYELEELAFYYTFNGFPKKAVDIYERIYSYDELTDSSLLNKIAAAYDSIRDVEKANCLYLKALEICLGCKHCDSSLVAMIYYNLANVQESNVEGSIEYFKKALSLELELYGEVHKYIVDTYVALAKCYNVINDDVSASAIREKIITLHKKGVNTYSSNYVLASSYFYKSDFENALKYYEIAYQLKVNNCGEMSSETVEELLNIAYTFDRLERGEDVIGVLNKAVFILEKNNINNNELIKVMTLLANAYSNLGNIGEALSVFKNIFDQLTNGEANLYELDKDYFRLAFWYAKTLNEARQYDESQKIIHMLHDSFRTKKRVIKLMYENYYHLGNFSDALKYFTDLLNSTYNDLERMSIYEYISACYQAIEKYDVAISNYLLIIDLASKLNIDEAINTSYFRIGYCYRMMNNIQLAIDSYKKGYAFQSQDYFLREIAICYDLLGEKNQSLDFNLQYLKINLHYISPGKTHPDFELLVNEIRDLAISLGRQGELPNCVLEI